MEAVSIEVLAVPGLLLLGARNITRGRYGSEPDVDAAKQAMRALAVAAAREVACAHQQRARHGQHLAEDGLHDIIDRGVGRARQRR